MKVRVPLALSLLMFITSFVGGFIYSYKYSNKYINNDVHDIEQLEITSIDMFSILKNNIKLIFLLAIPSFGFYTTLNLIFNGISNGAIIGLSIQRSHGIFLVLSLTLPHGIFEIPAIIIAGAAGFKIPYEIIRYLAGKKEQILTKEDIKEYLTLALISIILIVIAAFVEAYVTPRIAEHFLR